MNNTVTMTVTVTVTVSCFLTEVTIKFSTFRQVVDSLRMANIHFVDFY